MTPSTANKASTIRLISNVHHPTQSDKTLIVVNDTIVHKYDGGGLNTAITADKKTFQFSFNDGTNNYKSIIRSKPERGAKKYDMLINEYVASEESDGAPRSEFQ